MDALQGCMDSSDWLQSTMHEESGMDSSSPSGDMLMCSRPMIERRLRPHHDQPLKCPRCDSTHTKFCYYNNYSLSQPRYFCKTCRRYWTKGGTLRNIPVGGGCRKNKKVSSKKVSSKKPDGNEPLVSQNHHGSSSHNPADIHLSFPDHQFQFSNLNNLLGNPSFVETKLINGINSYRNYDFMGSAEVGMLGGVGVGDMSVQNQNLRQNFHGFCSPYGISIDGNGSNGGTHFVDACQRLLLPYHDHEVNDYQNDGIDVKPNAKILALDWQEQGCSDSGKENFSYINGFGSSWNTIVNGYGPSATHPLV